MLAPFKSPWIFGKVRIITSGDFAFVDSQGVIVNKTVGAATAITLPKPPSAPLVFQCVFVTDGKGDAGVNNITVSDPNSVNINGSPTYVISSNYGSAVFMWNGTTWNVIAKY